MSAGNSTLFAILPGKGTKLLTPSVQSQTILDNADKLVDIIQDYREAALNDVRLQFQSDLLQLKRSLRNLDAEWKRRSEEKVVATVEASRIQLRRAQEEAAFWREETRKAKGGVLSPIELDEATVKAESPPDQPSVESSESIATCSWTDYQIERIIKEQATKTQLCTILTEQRDKAEAERQQEITAHQADVDILRKTVHDWSEKYNTLQKTHEDLVSYINHNRLPRSPSIAQGSDAIENVRLPWKKRRLSASECMDDDESS